MTNVETIQAYIDGNKALGKSAQKSLFWRDSLLFSYGEHFCMCRIDRIKKHARVTTRRYSVTTSKHMSQLRNALMRNGYEIYNVKEPLEINLTAK